MPILAIEDRVVVMRTMSEKTPAIISSFRTLFGSRPSCLRVLKQSEQNMSLPAIGSNGTKAIPSQEEQIVS